MEKGIFYVIILMAPVENDSKPLDQTEYRVYRKRTRVILSVEAMLFIVAIVFAWKELYTKVLDK